LAKLYEYNDAVETLTGLLSVQDRVLLAKELGKLMVKHASQNHGWTLKDLELSIRNEGGKFDIKVGNG